jgi:hypothetical protein
VTEARYRTLAEGIYGGIVCESARWGDSHREPPFTRDVEWTAERDRLLGSYFPRRTDVLLAQLRAASLYPDVEAPRFSQHGGRIPPGFSLAMTVSEGTIYYTLDGADPRIAGGGIAPDARFAGTVTSRGLVGTGAPVRVLVPKDEGLGLDWTAPDFDDSGWIEGSTGVGYERSSGYEALISTDVETGMYGVNATVYLRLEFSVEEPSDLAFLDLRMQYDDGFVAYLNGEPLASRNAAANPAWNVAATANRDDSQAVIFESIEIPGAVSRLRAGRNVLAIHGLNSSATSGDLLLLPELRATEVSGQGIALEGSSVVKARTWLDGRWSALAEAFFHRDVPLRITEVMFHPRTGGAGGDLDADAFEFVELQNIGPMTLDLSGFRLAGGIDYDFSEGLTHLPPDEVLLVVKDAAAFLGRYPSLGSLVAGEYSRKLGNDGDTIRLEGASGEPILDFAYDDAWYPETDGEGYSLIVLDVAATPETWGDPARWRPSPAADGSPGWVESHPPPGGGRQIPGNLNQDATLDISDPIQILLRLFEGLDRPLPCEGATLADGGNRRLADGDGNGSVAVTDAIILLDFLFGSGPPHALGVGCVRIEGCPDVCPR